MFLSVLLLERYAFEMVRGRWAKRLGEGESSCGSKLLDGGKHSAFWVCSSSDISEQFELTNELIMSVGYFCD